MPRASTRGFTLIEMLVAVVLLGIAIVSLGRFMGSFQRTMTRSTATTLATAIARERLEMVRSDPRYTSLFTRYGTGTSADTTITAAAGISLRRRTIVSRDQTGVPARDFTTITVRVTSAGTPDTVNLTAVVAAP